MQQINEKIGAWLLVNKQSRAFLARELGMSRETLDKRISGANEWKFNEVISLSRLIGCTLEELI